jgi:uncharacterized protein YndB with AHSA1/START domain
MAWFRGGPATAAHGEGAVAMNALAQTRPELWIKRTFDAPRELVFKCWTDPERLKRWCCPKDFTIPFSEGEIRPGGTFKTCMRAPDGTDHWLAGQYKEIVPPEKIVFSHTWLDDSGGPGHVTTVTVTLAEEEGRTRLTLHQAFFQSEPSRDGHNEGWSETLDNLQEYLAK